MAENEEELKSFLMKVKEESEKAGLKLNTVKMTMLPKLIYGFSAILIRIPSDAEHIMWNAGLNVA